MCSKVVDVCCQVVNMCSEVVNMCGKVVNMCSKVVNMCSKFVAVEWARVAEAASEAEERAACDLTALQVCLFLTPLPMKVTTQVDRTSHSR